jgi:hypothetical protein
MISEIQLMKAKYLIYFFSVLFFLSCLNSPEQNKPDQKRENKPSIKKKPESTFPDTLKINIPAAVFYNPDSIQLEKIRSITDKYVFEATMHESYYLTRTAHLVIERDMPKLKIIDAKNVRYLLFKYANKSSQCIDLDEKNDAYGLFLFNTQKPPILVDMANIETQLSFYFSK